MYIVAELSPEYVSQNKIIIQSEESNRFKEGDIVKLVGRRATGAIVAKLLRGPNKVFLDKYLRDNLGVRLGDEIKVEPFNAEKCKSLELTLPPGVIIDSTLEKHFRERLMGRPVSRGDKISLPILNFQLVVQVARCVPRGIVVVNSETKISGVSGHIEDVSISYDDIGGLDAEIRRIREIVEYPIRFPEVFRRLGIEPPKGIILYGLPGTGKTLLAKALMHETRASFFTIQGPELLSSVFAESEARLRKLFEDAAKNAPSIIFIDELDSITNRRESSSETERRLVAQMLALLDGIKERGKIVVIGATNRIKAVDPALRRPGRFESEIYIGVPNDEGRRKILEIYAYRMPLENVNLDLIVEKTRGFVGADLESLCREAAYNCIRRTFGAEQLEHGDISLSDITKLKVKNADFELALSKIKPSALREVIVEIPKVRWGDVGGLDDIKQLLKENVEYAIRKREAFEKMGIKPVKGILLHGPPGTGKTLLAMAIANECSANFISVKGPEVFSKWLGESEENIRFIFSKAREVAPCIIFFDEIDAVAVRRGAGYGGEGENAADRVVNQILTEMDGIESLDRVVVIAATNRIDMIDPALLRPGRFDYTISVPMPDFEARKSIFRIHTRGMPIAEIDIDELAKSSEGFAGSDIMAVCREAGMQALRRNSFEPTKVTKKDFVNALEKVKKTISQLKKETEYSMIYGGPIG